MAPSAIDIEAPQGIAIRTKQVPVKEPLKYAGNLDQFRSKDLTPHIGTEYPEANLVDLLKSANADDLLRDLAIKSIPIRAYLRVAQSSPSGQFHKGALSSSGNKTTSRMISRRNSFSA